VWRSSEDDGEGSGSPASVVVFAEEIGDDARRARSARRKVRPNGRSTPLFVVCRLFYLLHRPAQEHTIRPVYHSRNRERFSEPPGPTAAPNGESIFALGKGAASRRCVHVVNYIATEIIRDVLPKGLGVRPKEVRC